MKCPTCPEETSVHHESDGLCFLTCGHTARRNPGATSWTGYLDGVLITLDLTGSELVPAGDMHSHNKWTDSKCPECFEERVPLVTSHDGVWTHMILACGHAIASNGTTTVLDTSVRFVKIPQEEHTQSNTPARGYPSEVAPTFCSVCNNPGGDFRVNTLPNNKRTCGHGFSKDNKGIVRPLSR